MSRSHRYPALGAAFHQLNRKNLAALLPADSLFITVANKRISSNADAYYPHIFNKDHYYLSGLSDPDSWLLVKKSRNGSISEHILLPEVPEWKKAWEGEGLGTDLAAELSGVENIGSHSRRKKIISSLVGKKTRIYLPLSDQGPQLGSVADLVKYVRKLLPDHDIRSHLPYLHDLRTVKSDEEISMIREAIKITGKALRSVLPNVAQGMNEYAIEAELLRDFLASGSRGFAFEPIIASGNNSCILHYVENSSKIRKGKVLLLDIGAEYGGYNADITRTVFCSEPPKQSERVYDAVHRTLKSSVKFFKPGSSIKEVNGKVAGLIEAELLELGLITSNDIKNQNSGNPAYRKYYMHGASHYLGLDVHDPGKRDRKLEQGMILTLEPGIYVPEWETGVRLEEDLLITKDGCEVLSKNIPLNWKNLVK